MKSSLLAPPCLVIAAALVTSGAAAPKSTRTLATAGSVVALSADGPRVAIATTGLARACDRVVLWNAVARTSARWAAHTNCGGGQTSGGQALKEIALAGTRALWVESISGNNQELALWSARPGQKPAMLAFETNGNGAGGDPAGDYLGHVHADGTLAAFNTWRVCDRIPPGGGLIPPCVPGQIGLQTLWRVTPAGKRAIRQGADATFVAAVDAGRIAVQHDDGTVTLFSSSGAPSTTLGLPDGKFAGLELGGAQLAAIRNGALEVYSSTTGALAERFALPASPTPTLRDLDAGLAVYTAGRTVHVVRVASGKNRAWAAPTAVVGAQLEGAGLWYAYNVSGKTKGRIAFVPRAQVAARVR